MGYLLGSPVAGFPASDHFAPSAEMLQLLAQGLMNERFVTEYWEKIMVKAEIINI